MKDVSSFITVDWAALAKQWIAQREAVGTAEPPPMMGGAPAAPPVPPPPPPEEAAVQQHPENVTQNDMEICEDEGAENHGPGMSRETVKSQKYSA